MAKLLFTIFYIIFTSKKNIESYIQKRIKKFKDFGVCCNFRKYFLKKKLKKHKQSIMILGTTSLREGSKKNSKLSSFCG